MPTSAQILIPGRIKDKHKIYLSSVIQQSWQQISENREVEELKVTQVTRYMLD